jgi:hypothetical protein
MKLCAPSRGSLWATLVCLVALAVGPVYQLQGLSLMPGDAGDPRLNNYFLENIFQFILGRVDSLWHLGFFYPFPWVVGFSDNLFGASPLYIVPRALGAKTDTAFQLWFLAAYPTNYLAAYITLKRLQFSSRAAVVGALVFAFSLPVTAYAGHAQLHYRFAIPFAVFFFHRYLIEKNPLCLSYAALWMTWQFYLTIYVGFFTLVLLIAMTLVFIGWRLSSGKSVLLAELRSQGAIWLNIGSRRTRNALYLLVMALLFMGLLFYPYFKVTHLYHAHRSADEIKMMLPRPESYFFTDISLIWPLNERFFSYLPNSREHQMFWGIIPFVLCFSGARQLSQSRHSAMGILLTGSMILIVGSTLYVGDWSLWLLICQLPLASAIRAVTRLDLVLLFPVAFLCALSVEHWFSKCRWVTLGSGLIVVLMIIESSALNISLSTKSDWRHRVEQKVALIPKNTHPDSILFFAQGADFEFLEELDAMWASLQIGLKTLNGYSGNLPEGLHIGFGDDCSELIHRVQSYEDFAKDSSYLPAQSLILRIIPIGFHGCDPSWNEKMPRRSGRLEHYPQGFYENLELQFLDIRQGPQGLMLHLALTNHNPEGETLSVGGKNPVLMSWRWLDANGQAIGGWDYRHSLPFDVLAGSTVNVELPIDSSVNPRRSERLEVSIVHETMDWAHHQGFKPITVQLTANLLAPK